LLEDAHATTVRAVTATTRPDQIRRVFMST
jgi:hypothetical protein